MKKLLITILIISASSNAWGWWDKSTHRVLAEKAARIYFNNIDPGYLDRELKLFGNKQKTNMWLQDGAQAEDNGIDLLVATFPDRSLNHFHDPTKSLADAGLNDTFSGMSAITWSQNPEAQSTKTSGDWTWQKVREQQYNSLTYTLPGNRDAFEASMLKGLGYQMHLLHDMSQPNHVRNDTHVFDGMGVKIFNYNNFETWAKNNPNKVANSIDNNQTPVVTVDLKPAYPNPAIVSPVARLYDNRTVDGATTIIPSISLSQGLAEYTNANFFSEDTIFADVKNVPGDPHYFAYPAKSETDLQSFINGTLNTAPYIEVDGIDVGPSLTNYKLGKLSADGQDIECMAKSGAYTKKYYREFGEGLAFYNSFFLDDECFTEQASYLFPRAVGYSAALLDYFFRGKLETSLSTQNPSTSSTMRLMLKNATPDEEMTGGKLALVLRYRQVTESGATLVSPSQGTDFSYMVIELPSQPVPSGTATEYSFTLPQPLPLWTKDLAAQVVYQGTLGNETNAVAVSPWKTLQYNPEEIELKLPAAGVYAATTGTTPFNEIRLNARNNLPTGETMTDGTISLYALYRTATADPFQSTPVISLPADGYTLLKVSESNLKRNIPKDASTELAFDLSTSPLPLWATDVYLYVVYQGTLIDGVTTKPNSTVIGKIDISEPTPVDVFNNADKVCVSKQWYTAGSPEAIALADSNGNAIPDLFDPYAHNIDNIFTKDSSTASLASSTNYTFSSPTALTGGDFRRLGYILTDYSFNYSFLENWVNVSANDPWTITGAADQHPGTAVKNQTDADGNYIWPGMYSMRGNKMWWGASIIWDNDEYQSNPTCDWSTLP